MKPEQKEEFKKNLVDLYAYLKGELHLKETPKVVISKNEENAKKLLGGTAHYEPDTKTVKLYILDRHPKDILRSFSHEIIHHWQNEHNQLNKGQGEDLGLGYAQKDVHLRKMEKQAYLLGNIMFRDWEDKIKTGKRKNPMLNEHAERIVVNGRTYGFYDAMGPFILFNYKNESYYVYSNTQDSVLKLSNGNTANPVWDDGKPHTNSVDTHGPLVWTMNYLFPELKLDRNPSRAKPSAHGRMWKVGNKVYLSFWNDPKTMQIKNYLNLLEQLIEDQGGITDLNSAFIENKNGKFISFSEYKKKGEDIIPSHTKSDRELHLLLPSEKSKALKQKGVQGKILQIPDWEKRQQSGVDENLDLTDRNESRQRLKLMLMDMIRAGIIKTSNPTLTTGPTQGKDFAEELSNRLQVALEKQLSSINWMGDKYIGPNIE